MRTALFIFITLITLQSDLFAQPKPGDYFREYTWIPDMVTSPQGRFLRVGGKLGYKVNPNHFPSERHQNGYIPLEKYVQLKGAIRAEVMIEKVASHVDTRDLTVSMNRYNGHRMPVSKGIPQPESEYMHHTNPTVEIPLTELKEGNGNEFKFEVDSVQRWGWEQNLVYGLTLRVYYDASQVKSNNLVINNLSEDGILLDNVTMSIEDPNQSIREVQYLGLYDGVNYEGDGIYRQWHYHLIRGKVKHHLGTSDVYPFSVNWNTSWIPDQKKEIKLSARIVYNDGMIYFSKPIGNLSFQRDYKVKLCKPSGQPRNWVTRSKEFETTIQIPNSKEIKQARMIWTSWSPCYSNGIYINNKLVFDKEGPCYEYMHHDIAINDLQVFKEGENIIKTGKEPLHNGQMVHGMEVQWPGIMVLIKYEK